MITSSRRGANCTMARLTPLAQRSRTAWLAATSLCAALLTLVEVCASAPSAVRPLNRIEGELKAGLLASGLLKPDGLAIHPRTDDLYVAERGGNRISIIRDGKSVTVIDSDWKVINEVPVWALDEGRDRAFWTRAELDQPIALAFSENGHLFVSEDQPSARLLEFIPNWRGQYTKARVVPVPWLNKRYAWKGVVVARDGRLFLAGAAQDSGPGLHFGSTLMRDVEGHWWVVDYGPFTSFASIALSRRQDILLVGDDRSGGVTWWDTTRHKVIGAASASVPNTESICLLPDGSFAVAQKVDAQGSVGGRIFRVNPQTDETQLLASGFGRIEAIISFPKTGRLYVSESDTGNVIELAPRDVQPYTEYLLRRSLYTFEMAQGLAPKEWPEFMERFVKKLGVRPTEEAPQEDGRDMTEEEDVTFTVREFTDRIPMIAGRVKVVGGEVYHEGDDPVEQLDFVVFYPGQTLLTGPNATPSLSLFSATHKSGRVERTRVVKGYQSSSFDANRGWTSHSRQAHLYFPMTTCTAERKPNGVDLNIAFLGMGFSEDYYLELHCGQLDQGRLVIDGRNGILGDYEVAFTERTMEGREVRNILIAGFDPELGQEYSWLKIGKTPVGTKINLDDHAGWMSYRMGRFKDILRDKELQWRVAGWEAVEDDRRVTVPGGAGPTAKAEEGDSDSPCERPDNPRNRPARPERTRIETMGDGHAYGPPTAADDASAKPRAKVEPPTDLPPHAWTNLILSRAIESWKTETFQ